MRDGSLATVDPYSGSVVALSPEAARLIDGINAQPEDAPMRGDSAFDVELVHELLAIGILQRLPAL